MPSVVQRAPSAPWLLTPDPDGIVADIDEATHDLTVQAFDLTSAAVEYSREAIEQVDSLESLGADLAGTGMFLENVFDERVLDQSCGHLRRLNGGRKRSFCHFAKLKLTMWSFHGFHQDLTAFQAKYHGYRQGRDK